MTAENTLKAITVGVVASFLTWVLMLSGIEATELTPYNLPPATALLYSLGLESPVLGALLHFAWGVAGSLALVGLLRDEVDVPGGLLVAGVMYLIGMVAVAPAIGWGLFGAGRAGQLPFDHPLYLEAGPTYPVLSFTLHVVYGVTIGLLNALWYRRPGDEPRRAATTARAGPAGRRVRGRR